jgi:hypothetical protein
MSPSEARHRELTAARAKAYAELFGGPPSAAFPAYQSGAETVDPCLIDVFTYALETWKGPVVVAVTSGMSDRRMTDPDDPGRWSRRELIQYFRECTPVYAQRLQTMASLTLSGGFFLDALHTLAGPFPTFEGGTLGWAGAPWVHAFFLEPVIRSHREFRFPVDGDDASFLWHVPISDAERAYKLEHGANALLDRMDAVELPWIFDEKDRPPLVG